VQQQFQLAKALGSPVLHELVQERKIVAHQVEEMNGAGVEPRLDRRDAQQNGILLG